MARHSADGVSIIVISDLSSVLDLKPLRQLGLMIFVDLIAHWTRLARCSALTIAQAIDPRSVGMEQTHRVLSQGAQNRIPAPPRSCTHRLIASA
jgi:hypothetical protein